MTATDDTGVENPKVKPPRQSAAGVPAVMHALEYSLEQTSLVRTAINLLNINQTNGIDCPGCAWPEPEPGKRHKNEYCENGAKHINDEATTRRITRVLPRALHLRAGGEVGACGSTSRAG